jgi:hypothetical protein
MLSLVLRVGSYPLIVLPDVDIYSAIWDWLTACDPYSDNRFAYGYVEPCPSVAGHR